MEEQLFPATGERGDAPVALVNTGSAHDGGSNPEDGIALCLSGGGYRAMLFHVGALWRFYDAGLMKDVDRVSSVSGGSITAALLALKWDGLSMNPAAVGDDFVPEVVAPIRNLAGRTIDANSVLGGIFLPGTVAEKVAGAYRKHLFGDRTEGNDSIAGPVMGVATARARTTRMTQEYNEHLEVTL